MVKGNARHDFLTLSYSDDGFLRFATDKSRAVCIPP